MSETELNLVKQILTENPVCHSIKYNKEKPVDIYTVFAEYETNKNSVQKDVLTVAHTPSMHLCEIYIGGKCIYAKTYQKLGTININKNHIYTDEEHLIGDIINICRSKISNKYTNQLKQIQTFLTQLKKQDLQK